MTVNNGGHVLFFVHRRELIEQIEESFIQQDVNLEHTTIMTVGKVANRLDKLPKPTLIICDEGHHSRAKTYEKIFDYYKDVPRLGFTATPWRLNGRGFDDIYDEMIEGQSVQWLIDNKFLAPYKYYSVNSIDLEKLKKSSTGDFTSQSMDDAIGKTIFGDAVSAYKKYANGQKTIIYAHSVDASKHLADEFTRAGIAAKHADAKTPKAERDKIMSDFKSGDLKIISNVDLISEGFNVPDCSCVMMIRPTASLVFFIQQSMRCMRYRPDKTATIIDMVANYQNHGLPSDEREWTLGNRKNENKIKVKECDFCHGVFMRKDWQPACDFDRHPRWACPSCYELLPYQVRDAGTREKKVLKDVELEEIKQRQSKMAKRNPYKSKSIKNIYNILESQKELGTRPIKYPFNRALHIRMDQLHGDIPLGELKELAELTHRSLDGVIYSYELARKKHSFKENDTIQINF